MADKTTTVHSPVEGFTGTVAGVEFAKGTGETSDQGALAYFRRKGYGIGEPATTPEEPEAPAPADPQVVAGTPLRDAAVDPDETDPADLFDPSAHSVDDVNAYLAQADPDEQTRVLEAEKAGKDRKTVSAPDA